MAVGSYAAADALLADSRAPTDSGFPDTVLASRAVTAAVRLAVIAAAAYVIVSAFVLARRGQFLTRIGPVEASERVAVLMAENAELKADLDAMRAEVRALQGNAELARASSTPKRFV